MDRKLLKIINIATFVLILLVISEIMFLNVDRNTIDIGIAVVLFFFAVYLSVRKSIQDSIDAHGNLEAHIDLERKKHLKHFEYYSYILWLVFSIISIVFAWMYMRDQLLWAIIFSFSALLLVSFYDLFLTVTYLIANKPFVNLSSLAIQSISILVLGVYVWEYMHSQFFFMAFISLIMLLLTIFTNARDAVNAIKRINGKPVDLKKEKFIYIIDYLPIIVFVALILIICLRLASQFEVIWILLGILIVPLTALMIVANAWKLISDLRSNPA